jgi:hypothetical protein
MPIDLDYGVNRHQNEKQYFDVLSSYPKDRLNKIMQRLATTVNEQKSNEVRAIIDELKSAAEHVAAGRL